MAFSTGHDMKNEFRFNDGLGKTYVVIATTWSIILFCGGIFLILNRELPFLRIRNISLTISAVAILHVYWVLCLFAYGLNGFFPCATEFWIMNIYLPIGIALFHLSNTKLLEVAVLQRKYLGVDSSARENKPLLKSDNRWTYKIGRLNRHSLYEKTKWTIGLGLTVQLVCALTTFLLSRKFHSSYGLVGNAAPESPTTKRECRKGWEWLFSIVWQFMWSWVFAPYLLWKVRGIQDTHGWRIQTIVCCVAGLPASPMWLLSLYLPQMAKASMYYIPPLWFAPSIFLIEAFMVFLPCWHVLAHRHMKNETLRIIKKWEEEKNGSSVGSDSTYFPQSPQRISHKPSVLSTTSSRKAHSHMYTMGALEKALQANSTPLLLFAALKDFTGENISFLKNVQQWNKNWPSQRSSLFRGGFIATGATLRYQQFIKAVEIYSSFVSLRSSTFPINISHIHLKELETIFESAASTVSDEYASHDNSVTPFDDVPIHLSDIESRRGKDGLSMVSTIVDVASNSSCTEIEPMSPFRPSTVTDIYQVQDLADKFPTTLSIPLEFGPSVFDKAVDSVKYMVLTNTWPKFVDAGYAAHVERGTSMERFQERLTGCGIGRSRTPSY